MTHTLRLARILNDTGGVAETTCVAGDLAQFLMTQGGVIADTMR